MEKLYVALVLQQVDQQASIQEQMRSEVIDIYHSEKGYEAISTAVGLQ